MKKLLTIALALLLITATCFANDISTIAGKAIGSVSTIAGKAKTAIATVGGGGVPSEAAGACTSPQIFGWSMENVDVTTGTPAGCTGNADTTFAYTGTSTALSTDVSPQDGTYSLYIRYAGDNATIPITGSGEEGTFDVYVELTAETSLENWSPYLVLSYGTAWVEDTNSYIALKVDSSNHFVISYGYSGGHVNCISTVDYSALNGWIRIIGKWKRGAATTLSITVNGTETTSSTALSALAGSPDNLTILNGGANSRTLYWDTLKVYSTWQ